MTWWGGELSRVTVVMINGGKKKSTHTRRNVLARALSNIQYDPPPFQYGHHTIRDGRKNVSIIHFRGANKINIKKNPSSPRTKFRNNYYYLLSTINDERQR